MRSFDKIADLPLTVESYRLEARSRRVSPRFVRHTTLVRLRGGGCEGVGEDVTWDVQDQQAFQEAGATLPLVGPATLASFSARLARLDTFPRGPGDASYRHYRRWAFESAALDLALRLAQRGLAAAFDRTPRPVRFVVSMGLGDPPRLERVMGWLEHYPAMRFKLDANERWDAALIRDLAATGAIEVVDLKGAYHGTAVDLAPNPALYARIAEGLPDAWLEDPALTPETDAVLAAHRARITWDAPIHSVRDIEGLAAQPQWINIKPSRFGSLSDLCDAYDYCVEQGIAAYGGGQHELGPGRGQIQALAALFHATAPNDVAPRAYNLSDPVPGLPPSPLEPHLLPTGFGREDEPNA